MRAKVLTISRESQSAQLAGGLDDDRAIRAVHLLQEALLLLGKNSTQKSGLGLVSVSDQPDRLLRLPEVQRLTGLGRSVIYQQMRDGIFPRSVKVGPRAASWSEEAIHAWIRQRLEAGGVRVQRPEGLFPACSQPDRTHP